MLRHATLVCFLLAACGDDASTTPSVAVASYAAVPSHQLDLLVQMDNTLADEQENLAANLPVLLDVLATLPGGMPDLHVGVVTSDLGASGSLDRSMPGPDVGTACMGTGDDGALQVSGATVSKIAGRKPQAVRSFGCPLVAQSGPSA